MKEFDPERWRRLASHLARARAKPTWDVEERKPKLVIADRFRQALEVADESELPARLARLEPAVKRRFALLRPDDLEWLKAWAAADPGSLVAALQSFTAKDTDAVTRFEAWAGACARAAESGHVAPDPDAALAIGSFFNFGLDPRSTPLMSDGVPPQLHDEPGPRGEAMFDLLEAELGYARAAGDSLPDRYGRHLHFAELLQRGLSAEGIVVRDMIDVQSLTFIAVLERGLWASDPPPGPVVTESPDAYLAICTVYRDEAPYLPEWIEFHRVVGVERFFLYDNRSSDDHEQVLAPYIRDGTVVLHDWPGLPVQTEVFDHCLAAHGKDARWIAFIDLDEFLFSPELRPLPEVLREFEQYPAVGVNWAAFGTSGHRTKPAGLVIESYLRRGSENRQFIGRSVKCIVQPAATIRCLNAHRFEYRHGLAVDENGYPIHGGATKSVYLERLRINHYFTRSEAELRKKIELREKLERSGTPGWHARPRDLERAVREFNDEHDDLITAYGPEVRAALEKAEQPA